MGSQRVGHNWVTFTFNKMMLAQHFEVIPSAHNLD